MKLLEIKNNLVKMSYDVDESVWLSQFIAIVEDNKSYIAQIINLKSDVTGNYAVAKLIFVFNKAGMVDNYDGSIPTIAANVSVIDVTDILKLIPVERPVLIGKIAQNDCVLKLDETIFENHLTICAEKFEHISTTIKNAVSQISKNNEKIIVIDTDNNFVEYQPTRFKKDFKLPLNYDMINYIYDNDLEGIEPVSKAIIQDIFLSVQEYAKTAKNEFIPFDTFLDVVKQQYKATDMAELALLENKLLKYQEENIFAQTNEEVVALEEALKKGSVTYVDISDVDDSLQKELIRYIYKTADKIEAYIYNFVKLTNKNSDKKLLKQLLDNEHIFTSIICSHSYKYVSELKQRADNLILFAPQTVQHDFASYNTILNRLNANEFIVYGELTQHIPFIIELKDFENEDFTKEPADTDLNTVEDNPTMEIKSVEPEMSERHDEYVQEMINDNFDMSKLSELEQDEYLENDGRLIEQDGEFQEFDGEDNNVDFENEQTDFAEEFLEQTPEYEELQQENVNFDDFVQEFEQGNDKSEIVEQDENVDDVVQEEQGRVEDFGQEFLQEEPVGNLEQNLQQPSENIDNFGQEFEQENNGQEIVEQDENLEDFLQEEQQESFENFEQELLQEEPVNKLEQDLPQQDENINSFEPEFEQENNGQKIVEQNEEQQDILVEDDGLGYSEDEESLPVYPSEEIAIDKNSIPFEQGDTVQHAKYGKGVIEKIIKYGNKTLCSIAFEEVGKRLLDPSVSGLEKLS